MAALQPTVRVVWNMAARFGRLLNIRLKLNKSPYNYMHVGTFVVSYNNL